MIIIARPKERNETRVLPEMVRLYFVSLIGFPKCSPHHLIMLLPLYVSLFKNEIGDEKVSQWK